MQKRRTNLRLWFLLFVSIFSGQRKSPIILQVSTWINGQHLEQNNTEAIHIMHCESCWLVSEECFVHYLIDLMMMPVSKQDFINRSLEHLQWCSVCGPCQTIFHIQV
jgi:hypothetical protein